MPDHTKQKRFGPIGIIGQRSETASLEGQSPVCLLSYTLELQSETASLAYSQALQSSANDFILEPGVLKQIHIKVAGF